LTRTFFEKEISKKVFLFVQVLEDPMKANFRFKEISSKAKVVSKSGTTFIEIMVAVALMAVLFQIGWAISNSFLGVKKVRNYEIAVALANQAIEAARAARFRELGSDKDGRKDTLLSDFSNSAGVYDGEKGEGFVPIIKVGDIEFKREVHILDAPSLLKGMESGLKLIRVLVFWKAPEDGLPMVFEAVSTIAE